MSLKMTSIVKFGLLAFLGAGLAGCGSVGTTYGTGESVGKAFGKDLASIATFGKVKGSNEKIDIVYEDRSPLVKPGTVANQSFPVPSNGKSAKEIADEKEKAALAKILRTKALAAGVDPNSLPATVPTKTATSIPILTLNEVDGTNEKKRSGINPFGFSFIDEKREKERQFSSRELPLTEVPREYRVVTPETVESASKGAVANVEVSQARRRVPPPI